MFSEILTGINAFGAAKKQKREANKINPQDVTYKESQYAKEGLDTARNMLNGRMAGANAMQQGALTNQSNAFLNLSRAAGSPQQMMAAAGALQGNTNSALDQLAIQEAQYKQSMLGNFNNALGAMTNEGDKVYNDQLRKYNRDYDMKQNLLNSAALNKQAGFKGIGGFLDGAANLAMTALVPGSGLGGQDLSISAKAGGFPTVGGNYARLNPSTDFNQTANMNYQRQGSSINSVQQYAPSPATSWFNPVAYSNGITPYRP